MAEVACANRKPPGMAGWGGEDGPDISDLEGRELFAVGRIGRLLTPQIAGEEEGQPGNACPGRSPLEHVAPVHGRVSLCGGVSVTAASGRRCFYTTGRLRDGSLTAEGSAALA